MPRPYVDGGLIIGDSASLLNSQRLKGIHTGIKSGMLAAETIYEALCAGELRRRSLSALLRGSWKRVGSRRNCGKCGIFIRRLTDGLYSGLAQSAVQFVSGGRGFIDPLRSKAGYEEYTKLNRRGHACGSIDAIQRRRGDHL